MANLSEDTDALDAGALALKPRGEIRQFLADRGGRRGLAVGSRQHRRRGMTAGQGVEQGADGIDHGQQQRRARVLQHQGVGEVVDILGRTGEMQPFEIGGSRAARLEFGAQPNFDRLHIVIGARFDLLDGRHVGGGRVLRQGGEEVTGRARQLGQRAGRGTRGERQEPGAFHAHPLAHEAGFAE